ncbi:MAG: hypothetical protein ACXAAR_02450 [Candidatus Thorarchaeota archaeon]|jgi:amino acid transporter
MNDDEMSFRFEEDTSSLYPTVITSIIGVIMCAILVIAPFEAIRRMQMGDYSLYAILLVIVSGTVLVVCSMIIKENEDSEL